METAECLGRISGHFSLHNDCIGRSNIVAWCVSFELVQLPEQKYEHKNIQEILNYSDVL